MLTLAVYVGWYIGTWRKRHEGSTSLETWSSQYVIVSMSVGVALLDPRHVTLGEPEPELDLPNCSGAGRLFSYGPENTR